MREIRGNNQRIPRAWQFANSFTTLNPTGNLQLQENLCYHGLSYIGRESVQRGIYCPMGWNKKRKTVTPIWRQINTQSSSREDCLVGDMMVEPENIATMKQEHEDHIVLITRATADSTLSSSSVQAENTVGEAEGLATQTSTCQNDGLKDAEDILGDFVITSAFQNSCGVGDADIISTVSKEKHAVKVEIGTSVMRFIRGKDGSTQKGIEDDMGVKLIFPSSKKEDSIGKLLLALVLIVIVIFCDC